jgi:hypothetical protein
MTWFLTAPNNAPPAAWLDAAPERDRAVLRRLGIAPDAHPRAAEYNQRLLEAARRCFEFEDLAKAAARLHVEVFGGDAAGVARLLKALRAANRADDVCHLCYVLVGHDGAIRAAGAGGFEPLFVLRAIQLAADALDGLEAPAVVDPPEAAVVDRYRGRFRRDVAEALDEIARRTRSGEVAGLAIVVCGPQGRTCQFVGAIPPRAVATALGRFCDDVERQSGAMRPRANPLAKALMTEVE